MPSFTDRLLGPRLESVREPAPLSRAAYLYIAGVGLLGVAMLVVAFLYFPLERPEPLYLFVLFAVFVVLDQMSALLPGSRERAVLSFRLEEGYLVAMALLFPPAPVIALMVLATLANLLTRRTILLRAAFNSALMAVGVVAAFLVMDAIGLEQESSPRTVVAVVVGVAVFYANSQLAVAFVAKLAAGMPLREGLSPPPYAYVTLGAVSVGLLAGLVGLEQPWALPFALAAALVLQLVLQGRIRTYWDHERVRLLIAATDRAHRAPDAAAAERAVLDTAPDLLRGAINLADEPAGQIQAQVPDGGWLVAAQESGTPYEDEERYLLETLAAILASAREGARARQQLAEEARGQALGLIAHELRTPLTSILGFARTLLTGRLQNPEPALEQIVGAGEQMNRLISDLLALQRAREGRFSLTLAPVDLAPLLFEQVERYRGQSDQHTIELELPETPLVVQGDAERLGQVVANLLSNAIKYSPAGSTVTVTLSRRDGRARVEVQDEGEGVPESAREQLFTRFHRALEHRDVPGTGLGLAICRELIEGHGGEIGYRPGEEGGSCFWFELALFEPSKPPA